MRVNTNPNVEASVSFDTVQPGVYELVVKEVSPFTASTGSQCLKVIFNYVDPSALNKVDGTPANNPGNIIDNSLVVAPVEKQGKLRGFVEACGLDWVDFDTDMLIGRYVTAKVGVEEYKGDPVNKISRYVQK